MSGAARQKALAVILPALVTATGYWLFFVQGAAPIKKAGAAAPPSRPLPELQRALAARLAERDACLEPWRGPRAERLGRISQRLIHHGIEVVGEGPSTAATTPALEQVRAWRRDADPPGPWTMELRGPYGAVSAALAELAEDRALVLLRLELHPVKPGHPCRWTLVLWS